MTSVSTLWDLWCDSPHGTQTLAVSSILAICSLFPINLVLFLKSKTQLYSSLEVWETSDLGITVTRNTPICCYSAYLAWISLGHLLPWSLLCTIELFLYLVELPRVLVLPITWLVYKNHSTYQNWLCLTWGGLLAYFETIILFLLISLVFCAILCLTGFWGFGEIGRASCRERV